MIVFTDKRELINPLCYKFSSRAPIVMNLSSLYSGYIDLTVILTCLGRINPTNKNLPEFVHSVEFDMYFANAIMSDIDLFTALMTIMMYEREGYLVIVMIQRDNYRDAVMESLIKLIQERYGYRCWLIESMDDIDIIKESYYTPGGLLTLDADTDKYMKLVDSAMAVPIMGTVSMEDYNCMVDERLL